MTLREWVAKIGGREIAARKLGVSKEALHYWLTAKATPRGGTIFKINKLSQGRVTVLQILEETGFKKRDATPRKRLS